MSITTNAINKSNGQIFNGDDIAKIDNNFKTLQDAINNLPSGGGVLTPDQEAQLNKIGDLTTNGLTEIDLATAIKNDRTQLSDIVQEQTTQNTTIGLKANQSDLNATNSNVTNNTNAIAINAANIFINTTQIASLASGSPKGTYATLTDLQTAYPSGNTNIYVVTADGKWYYWNGSAWTSGGVYQSIGIADASITANNIVFKTLVGTTTSNKNLFNKLAVTNGYTISDTTGTLSSNVNYAVSEYIPITASTSYVCTLNTAYAFFDSNKVFISGQASGRTFTSPSNATYVRFHLNKVYLDTTQLEIGTVATTYEDGTPKIASSQVYDSSTTVKSTIDSKNTEDMVIKAYSKNLFNKATAIAGYYVSYGNGNLNANSSYHASDYIRIKPNTSYALLGSLTEQMALYDSNKKFVSGLAQPTTPLVTPNNAYYVRFSLKNATNMLNTFMIAEGSTALSVYEPYNPRITEGLVTNQNKVITVKQDGTGDFASLRMALESITDASVNNRYTVKVYEGTYDIMSYYATEITNETVDIGLRIPNYVDVIGIGNRDNIILDGVLTQVQASIMTPAKLILISTLNMSEDCALKNVVVNATNLRYAVHDDPTFNTNIPIKRIVENCIFNKYTGDNYGFYQAYGAGCRSGADILMKNCVFNSEMGLPYSIHNNTGFTSPCHIKLENCKGLNKNQFYNSFRFTSMVSGTKDTIELIGCEYPRGILIEEEYDYTNSVYKGGGIDFKVTGYGNSIAPHIIGGTGTKSDLFFTELNEEIEKVYCTNAVSKGNAVAYTGIGSITPMLSATLPSLYVGNALENGNEGDYITIKKKGYIPAINLGISAISQGDKVGIVNGIPTIVTTGDYIGTCKTGSYVLLI